MQRDDTDLTIDLTDEPILSPAEDTLGVKTIARTLATSIREMRLPVGVAFGINGSWGIGKTSLIKLVEHYVKEDEKNKKKGTENTEVEIVHFQCWWFNNEEALILNFLKTLLSSLDKRLKGKARKLFSAVRQSLAPLKPVAKVALNATTGGNAQLFTGMLDSIFSKKENKSMDSLFQDVSVELKKNDKKRYLVIIDDIDRLSAPEMTMMFRLVKTLGHLPNVVYLLAFDRALAEQALSKVYPGKDKTPEKTPNPGEEQNPSDYPIPDQNPGTDPNFLEKIIQSFINIPVPNEALLEELVVNEVEHILGDVFPLVTDGGQLSPSSATRTICQEYIHTPRDFKRYKNALLTTYPAVKGKIYAVDYLVMEAWRIFEPELHAYIESKCPMRDIGIFIRTSGHTSSSAMSSFQSNLLHKKIPKERKDSFTDIVYDMFPPDEDKDYVDRKRIASMQHFKTYFYWSAEAIPPFWSN